MDRAASRGGPNRAARLARWLVRRSRRPAGAFQIVSIAVCLLLWFGLTAAGSYLASLDAGANRAQGLFDAFYGPFTFLTPQSDYVVGKALHPLAAAGRFFGVLLPVIGVYWLAMRLVAERSARWLLARRAAGHVVVIGSGGSADALALSSAEAGDVVALLGNDNAAAPDDRMLRAGVVMATGAAAAVARAAHARASFVWLPSDSDSAAEALALADALPATAGDVIARVERGDLRRALSSASLNRQPRVQPASPCRRAIRRALGGDALVADAVAAGQDRVTIVLIGNSAAAMAAADLVLAHCWSIHLRPPAIVTCGHEAEWTDWRRARATLFAPALFGADAVPTHDFVERESLSELNATRVIVDGADDDAAVSSGLALALDLAQHRLVAPAVQIILRTVSPGALLDYARLNFATPILLDQPWTAAEIEARAEDEAAALYHLAYLAQGGSGAVSWRELPASLVDANRAGADHAAVKRFDLAYCETSGMVEAECIDRLAEVEHRRWMAERLLDGWRPGPRDDGRRLHDKIVTWDRLSEAERDKDRVQVRQALGLESK